MSVLPEEDFVLLPKEHLEGAKMKFRELKNKLMNKFTLMVLFVSLFTYLVIYIIIKNEFFYSSINYITDYLDYYITKYLNGNAYDLLIDGKILLYIENDLANIFSSLYIYVVSFGSVIFKIYSFIIPFVIFYIINSSIHCEVYNKFSIPKITRIGIKKYINNTIVVNGIYSGLLLFVPRLIYLLILFVFFPIGISSTHYIAYSSFITQAFLYVGYSYNPFLLILIDLIMSFVYGVILSYISTLIVSLIKNKSLSYAIYLFFLGVLSVLPMTFKEAPFIFYDSLFNYFDQVKKTTTTANVFIPLIILLLFLIISYIITKIVFKKRIEKNI